MEYKFSENDPLLFNTKFLNTISKSIHGGNEDEIIRIEKNPLKVNVWLRDFDYKDDIKELQEKIKLKEKKRLEKETQTEITPSKETKKEPKVKPIKELKEKPKKKTKKQIINEKVEEVIKNPKELEKIVRQFLKQKGLI